MEACWKCEHQNVGGARFCAACGISQGRRSNLKSSLPTEYEQQAVDPTRLAPARFDPASAPSVVAKSPALAVGARVLVRWSDGQRYPGAVEQLAPGQCLVLFPNGQHYWIDARYVTEDR